MYIVIFVGAVLPATVPICHSVFLILTFPPFVFPPLSNLVQTPAFSLPVFCTL